MGIDLPLTHKSLEILKSDALTPTPAAQPAIGTDRELIKAIAMDIGKQVVAHIEVMYPQAIAVTASTFKLSVRNCIHNEIMAALEISDVGAIRDRLRDRKAFRRRWTKQYRDLRKGDVEIIKRNLDQSLAEKALEEGK